MCSSRCRSALASALIIVLAASASGCTLAGLGIGSTMDRYRDYPLQTTAAPEECEQERAVLKPAPPPVPLPVAPSAPAPARRRPARPEHPEVLARTPNALVVRTGGSVQPIDYGRVDHTECRVGTYALHGAAFGALGDGAVLITFLLYKLSTTDFPSSTKF